MILPSVSESLAILDKACEEYDPRHVFALFSGGHDSLAALAVTAKHPRFTGAAFINTGTGIPRTVKFVRETCLENEWPLIELRPDGKTYDDLIREKGFGHGPKSHNTAYYWLKQRQVRRLVKNFKGSYSGRVLLSTGVRRYESQRRMVGALSVSIRRDGAQVWVNPILDWSATEVSNFVDSEGLKRNPVVDTLYRSGECLCGTLFNKDDRDEILFWAPEMRQRVEAWETIAADAGHANSRWGVPRKGRSVSAHQLPLCVSCEAKT